MHNIDKKILKYLDCYYEQNNFEIPDNLNVYVYKEKDFYSAIKNKSLEVFGYIQDIAEKKLIGFFIYNIKNNEYNIYILQEEKNINQEEIITLFHELTHIHTIPILPDKCNKNMYYGYDFWKEFIANYLAFYTMDTINTIDYIENENKVKEQSEFLIKSMIKKNSLAALEELIPLLLLTSYNIKEFLYSKYTPELINEIYSLKNLCYKTINRENYREINNINLEKIGKKVLTINRILQNY